VVARQGDACQLAGGAEPGRQEAPTSIGQAQPGRTGGWPQEVGPDDPLPAWGWPRQRIIGYLPQATAWALSVGDAASALVASASWIGP